MATPGSNASVVSIHASVKDATSHIFFSVPKPFVSIHASVKDATKHKNYKTIPNEVSIHASVKDATHCYQNK